MVPRLQQEFAGASAVICVSQTFEAVEKLYTNHFSLFKIIQPTKPYKSQRRTARNQQRRATEQQDPRSASHPIQTLRAVPNHGNLLSMLFLARARSKRTRTARRQRAVRKMKKMRRLTRMKTITRTRMARNQIVTVPSL